MGKIFLDNDNIIWNSPTSKEIVLTGTNDNWEKGLDAIDNDYGDQLINNIAKSNRCKTLDGFSILNLRNGEEVGGVHMVGHVIVIEKLLAWRGGLLSYNVPILLI